MTWITPSTQSTGDVISAAVWNQNVVANSTYLYSPPMLKATLSGNLSCSSGDDLNFDSVSASGGFSGAYMTLGVGGVGRICPGIAGIYMASCGINFTFAGTLTMLQFGLHNGTGDVYVENY